MARQQPPAVQLAAARAVPVIQRELLTARQRAAEAERLLRGAKEDVQKLQNELESAERAMSTSSAVAEYV